MSLYYLVVFHCVYTVLLCRRRVFDLSIQVLKHLELNAHQGLCEHVVNWLDTKSCLLTRHVIPTTHLMNKMVLLLLPAAIR